MVLLNEAAAFPYEAAFDTSDGVTFASDADGPTGSVVAERIVDGGDSPADVTATTR
jgi:hypothetical protein